MIYKSHHGESYESPLRRCYPCNRCPQRNGRPGDWLREHTWRLALYPALAPQERHGQLDVVLRRVENGADPAYDLAVDYDRKTGSRCRVAARRLMRVSMFDRTDVRDWGCRTDRPNERRTAALAPQRTEPKSLLLLREGLPPSCVPPRQSRLTPDPVL